MSLPVDCEECGELTEDGRMRHFLCGKVVCRACYEREAEQLEPGEPDR